VFGLFEEENADTAQVTTGGRLKRPIIPIDYDEDKPAAGAGAAGGTAAPATAPPSRVCRDTARRAPVMTGSIHLGLWGEPLIERAQFGLRHVMSGFERQKRFNPRGSWLPARHRVVTLHGTFGAGLHTPGLAGLSCPCLRSEWCLAHNCPRR